MAQIFSHHSSHFHLYNYTIHLHYSFVLSHIIKRERREEEERRIKASSMFLVVVRYPVSGLKTRGYESWGIMLPGE